MGLGHTCGVKVLRIDRPDGRRVLKFDGPFGPRVVDCPSAMLIKSALRDLVSVPYSKITILLTGSLRSPPPLSGCAIGHTFGVRVLKMDRPAAGGS